MKPSVPEKEIRLGMSNLFSEIDSGFEKALKRESCFGRHAAWNFNGRVWWSNGRFYEEVWVHGTPQETISAHTLGELMERVSNKYGWD